MEALYQDKSVDELLQLCIDKGLTVAPELWDDKNALITLLGNQIPKVRIIRNYIKPAKKRNFDDFVRYFNKRYQAISAMLKSRKELQSVLSVSGHHRHGS
jgi:hypothetical protein